MNELLLVRHAETDANRNYIVQGRMDNPLNEYGRNQAMRTGEYFVKQHLQYDFIISSPLKRAFETAKIINQTLHTGKPIIVHQELIERNFGAYDGQKITDEYADLIKHGTIPHMEQNPDLEKRVFAALRDICRRYPDKKLMIVTHSHVIKAILVTLVKDFTYASYLNNCSISHLRYDNDQFMVLDYNINPLNE